MNDTSMIYLERYGGCGGLKGTFDVVFVRGFFIGGESSSKDPSSSPSSEDKSSTWRFDMGACGGRNGDYLFLFLLILQSDVAEVTPIRGYTIQ